ncbi:MAG: hypothetical protein LBU32_06525 [Clostridiales bacterium]|nr:hypothetical protein [Clostridiales bacterium]
MEALGLAILATSIIAVIIIAVDRWKYKEFGINTDNDITGKKSFGVGYVLSLLLAALVALAMSESKDLQAAYYVNGTVVKGGTNWMFVAITFLLGGGIIGLLIQLFSALPVLFMRSMSKEFRQNMRKLREAGTLPKVYRKKALAILLTLVTGGIGYWFYMKMWRMGSLYFLALIVGGVFSGLGFQNVFAVVSWLLFALTILSMLIAVRKKEVKLKNCIIYLE